MDNSTTQGSLLGVAIAFGSFAGSLTAQHEYILALVALGLMGVVVYIREQYKLD